MSWTSIRDTKVSRKIFFFRSYPHTLEYLINVQDVIIMQAGRFYRINKCAGGNESMQVVIFQNSLVKYKK